jgi:hypothetical protein
MLRSVAAVDVVRSSAAGAAEADLDRSPPSPQSRPSPTRRVPNELQALLLVLPALRMQQLGEGHVLLPLPR